MPTCKQCNSPIPEERVSNARCKEALFCSKKCGVTFHNRAEKALRDELLPKKKCLYCNKESGRKKWCGKACYQAYYRVKKNTNQMSTEDFAELNKGMAWDVPDEGWL